MDALLIPPYQFFPNSCAEENEIREIFVLHWEKLKTDFLEAINQINTWRQTTINNTNAYADDLLNSLTKDFNRLKASCQEQSNEHLATKHTYDKAQNVGLVNGLYESCRSLKFQLAQLESVTSELHCYRIVTVDEQIEKERNANSYVNKSQIKSEIDDTNNSEAHECTDYNSSVGTLSSNSNELGTESILVQSPNQSTQIDNTNNNELNSNGEGECPTCYMIFPKDMTIDKRYEHVHEHYSND